MRTFPVSCSSSLVFFDASTSTPGLMVTLRTSFSPTKFLISTSNWSVSLFFSMFTLMGKLGTMLVAGREISRTREGKRSLGFARGRHTGHRRNASCVNISHMFPEVCSSRLNSLVLVALGDTDDQVVLRHVSPCPKLPTFRLAQRLRRTMRVRTVRRVATLLREPW
jgi:hypothetical protein